MRVLMLHPHDVRFYPWTIRIIKLAEELAALGHEVHVACVEHKRAAEPDFPRLRELPNDTVRYTLLRSRDNQTYKNIAHVIRFAKDADIVHVQKCFASALVPALWSAWRWNKPLHYDWDDNETLILEAITGLPPGVFCQARFFERRLPDYVDTISVASDALWRVCREHGFPESRMVKVPVGADLSLFDSRNRSESFRREQPLAIGDRPLVVYVGQLEGAAYASLFVHACALLADRFPEAVWAVVGGGEMLADLEELAFRLDLSHRIIFTDYLSSDTIPDVLYAADIAVACFSDEEFVRCKSPLKVAEYLAAGKAIVASRVGEVPWMTGGAAVLVEPGSVEDLARGIAELLECPDKRRELGLAARARAESEINWRMSAKKLEEGYRLALSGGAGNPKDTG
ncbi:MAG: D-inositol-3-phosphate glycosyltransferase [bacterium]|nr:D-inositol-3-phosphate glycosyltransferase [bacterium]